MKFPNPLFAIIATSLLVTNLVTGLAQAEALAETPPARLASGGLVFIERGDHKPPDILSANGRYVLTVALYDRWTQRYVTTVDDADYSAGHLDLEGVGLDVGDLNPVSMGQGDKKVTVFADPAGAADIAMLREMINRPALREQYRIDVVFVPTRSQRSIALTKQLACLPGDVGLKAVLAGTTDQLPPARSRCAGFVALQKRVATATLVGVNATPYLVAQDTRIHSGRPQDLVRWLSGDDGSD